VVDPARLVPEAFVSKAAAAQLARHGRVPVRCRHIEQVGQFQLLEHGPIKPGQQPIVTLLPLAFDFIDPIRMVQPQCQQQPALAIPDRHHLHFPAAFGAAVKLGTIAGMIAGPGGVEGLLHEQHEGFEIRRGLACSKRARPGPDLQHQQRKKQPAHHNRYHTAMSPERKARILAVAARRQPDLTVFMERVHKPHNVAAILRSCDAVGVMRAHAVPPRRGIPRLNHTSGGTQRWIELIHHDDPVTGLQALKAQGFRLYAAHFSDQAVDFREPDYTQATAIVMGTEKYGVSDEALAMVDQEITIPMAGMAQSLNVSVATALILYEAQRQREAAGLYAPRPLSQSPWKELAEDWVERDQAHQPFPRPAKA
jgi:tRNA (guanosine-2'-O-)-methyltransferase